jgi:caspase domain-containing protein
MAGRYRALLIGNSTYPADEHNLQTLKGPVKDIAVLNRALVDRDAGLFDDVDVTLLPEATSTRAVRALGKFFGTAERDDVLLVYFSGHGKLDESARLHLCMQDTESTDLLSTAVSSTRINEFADASSAGNVVIVLDCCHAGAFRGGELGDAVAGPGRYVLTSCRGTQLANDATVENGTSFFTQHLVDGLLTAAPDSDGDGYVGFSDVYGYIDRQLRAEGKQIPQRRVSGDGDLPLARRAPPAPVPAAGPASIEEPPSDGAPAGVAVGRPVSTSSAPPRRDDTPTAKAAGGHGRRPSRRVLLAAVAGAVVIAGGIAAIVASQSGGSGPATAAGASGTYTADGPWRLRINGMDGPGDGCAITLTDTDSGAQILRQVNIYTIMKIQIHETGPFRWQVNSPTCLVTPLAGSGSATLPFTLEGLGDSDAFPAPAQVAVQVKNFNGNSNCVARLLDQANGQELDVQTATSGSGTVLLNPGGRRTVYVGNDSCVVNVSAAR